MRSFKNFMAEASVFKDGRDGWTFFLYDDDRPNVSEFLKKAKGIKVDDAWEKVSSKKGAVEISVDGKDNAEIYFKVGKKIVKLTAGSEEKIKKLFDGNLTSESGEKEKSGGKNIKDPIGGAPNSTYYYEQWQSIGMLGYISDEDCDAILNGKATNAIIKKFKSAYTKGLGQIGKGPKEFPTALDHPQRLQDAAMLVRGSIKFAETYGQYVKGGTIVWGDIDKYYSIMKTLGDELVKASEKENTADAVVLKGLSLKDLESKEGLVFEYNPTDNGVITVTQKNKKLGTILQVSMKKSHKDARLGKIKDVFSNKGFFGDTPADVLNRYAAESVDENIEYSESLQEGLMDFFKGVKSKFSDWTSKLKSSLNKVVDWVSKWLLGLVRKNFDTSKMQKSSEAKLNKYFGTLKESADLIEGNSADQMKSILNNKKQGQKIVNSIVNDMNKEVKKVRANIASINSKSKNNKFLGSQAIDEYPTFKVTKYNSKDYNTLRQYIMNYTSLEILNKMTSKISKGTKTLDLMVTTFIDFMESAYMGNTTLPIIKLFGIKKSSEKAVEIVDKESFDVKRDEIIKKMKSDKIPCGGAAARIKKGEGFGVFYLYTIAGIGDDGTVTYNNTRLTSYGQDLAYKIEASNEVSLSNLEKSFPSGK
tara:strand:- start:58 stop:1995 length:1938 start_codon:yes stop_codon:yes gene_type:complete